MKGLTDNAQKMYAEALITQVLQKAVMHRLTDSTCLTDEQAPNMYYWPTNQGRVLSNTTSIASVSNNNSNDVPSPQLSTCSTSQSNNSESLPTYYSSYTDM